MGQEALKIRRFLVNELRWESADVYTLVLKPESGVERLGFKAGQWVYLHLLDAAGGSWGRAAFSIATAPEESDEWIELAVKIHGDLTKKGAQLQPGDMVGIQGPFGVFVVPEDAQRLVFFAAGIGITPLRSMIRSLALQKKQLPITLLYSNKSVEETVYFEEFERLAKDWPSFQPVFFLTAHTPSEWNYATGRINAESFARYCPDIADATFLMCGPASFMDCVKGLLEERGVDVKRRLRKELFG